MGFFFAIIIKLIKERKKERKRERERKIFGYALCNKINSTSKV